jgi:GTP-binding protein
MEITKNEIKEFFKKEAVFVKGATCVDELPKPFLNEIAFAGRSNVGKSTLINALTGQKNLARTSSTPGRTQEVNFFRLGNKILLVDLPGYGYAKAPDKKVKNWTGLIFDYLKGRVPLRRVFLLIDVRQGVLKNDIDAMEILDKAAVAYQIVLTKADKVSPAQAQNAVVKIQSLAEKHPAMYPDILLTSAEKKTGLEALQSEIFKIAQIK